MQYWFQCQRCGRCCSEISFRDFGPPILPEEKARLERLAAQQHVDLGILPLARNALGVVVAYQMTRFPCPFLRWGRCTVWAQRPLFCRAYPGLPNGVGSCYALKGVRQGGPDIVHFPDQEKSAGMEFIARLYRPISAAAEEYSVRTGWRPRAPYALRNMKYPGWSRYCER